MASPTTLSPFERLPHVVLDIICGYLDDKSDHRPDLCAFSLTSHRCCATANTRRFNQIVLVVPNLDDLEAILADLKAVLGHGERYALVHRLRVQGEPRDEREPWQRPRPQDEEKEKKYPEDDDTLRQIERNFDGPPFCRLGRPRWVLDGGSNDPNVDDWSPLALFIRELPALRDLVWSGCVPQSLLDALHDMKRTCRLHVLGFRLHSLVYDRNSPRAIDPIEYALVTSPALYSIKGSFSRYGGYGELDYSPEVLYLIIQGLAPNLSNVWLETQDHGAGLDLDRSVALGRPRWRGFFLNGQTDEEMKLKGGTGSPRNLRLNFYIKPHAFNAQSMANLRHLHLVWDPDTSLALGNLAVGGHLPHLEMLSLIRINANSEPDLAAVNQILSHAKPLRHLHLTGHFSMHTFNLLTRQHGSALRSLWLEPHPAYYYEPEDVEDDAQALFACSTDAVQKMADRCPHLEELYIEMQRTRGDHREVSIYRALSNLTRLKRLVLLPKCTVHADENERTGTCRATVELLKEAFSNHAMDSALARAIFNIISPPGQGYLQYLRIEPQFVTEIDNFTSVFHSVMHSLGRNWVCQPTNHQNSIIVREYKARATRKAREHCNTEDWTRSRYREINNYEAMFKDLWPGDGPPWGRWTSLPLQMGDKVSE